MRKLFTLILVAFVLQNASAQEEEYTLDATDLAGMSLADLMGIQVTTASKNAESLDEAPNVMYVVTKDDIQNNGFKNLKDVLQTIPGFGVYLHILGQNVQVRGLAANENEKVSVMVNGVAINQFVEPIQFDGAINLDNAERIEIIVGPGSVLYGAETLEAIINIITKNKDGVTAKITTGTDLTKSATVTVGKVIEDDVSFGASFTYLERGGYDAYTDDALMGGNANLVGKNVIEEIRPSLFLTTNMRVKEWTIDFIHENLHTPEYMVIGNNWGKDGSRFSYVNVLNIKNEYNFSESLIGTTQIRYDNKRQQRVVTEFVETNAAGPSWDLSQNVYGLEYALQYNKGKHFLQGGIQSNYKLNRHNYAFSWQPNVPMIGNQFTDSTSFIESQVEQINTLSLGVYLSEDFTINDQFKLVGAVRFDYDEIVATEKVYVSPRFAFIYTPNSKWILKAMYNKATRMPNPWESTYSQIYGAENVQDGYIAEEDFYFWSKANPNVQRPEILTDYEMQAIHYLGKTRISVNGYYQHLQDFISWNTPYTNVGNFTGYGIETSVNTKFDNNLGILWTGTWNSNDFEKVSTTDGGFDEEKRPGNPDGKMLSVPEYTSYLALNYELPLYSGIMNMYLGVRYVTGIPMRDQLTLENDLDENGDIQYDDDGEIKQKDALAPEDFTYANNRIYLDANIGWTTNNDKFRVDLTGKNITNNTENLSVTWARDFYQPRGIVGMLAIRYKF